MADTQVGAGARVGHAILDQHPSWKVQYITSERFVNEFITSLRLKRMDDYRARFRDHCDVLLVDDIQFFQGKDLSQEEFFHTFNTLHELHKQIVITSDKVPEPAPGPRGAAEVQVPLGALAEVERRLTASVKSHLMSDVPLGALLSGGVDSSLVVALMSRLGSRAVKTFSVGFDAPGPYSELPFARQVAQHCGTEHHEIMVGAADLLRELPSLVWHRDEPMSEPAAIPTYMVSRFARESVTVVLTGEGGDELFAGYPKYAGEPFARRLAALPGPVRDALLTGVVDRLPFRFRKLQVVGRSARFRSEPERLAAWFAGFVGRERDELLGPVLRPHAGAGCGPVPRRARRHTRAHRAGPYAGRGPVTSSTPDLIGQLRELNPRAIFNLFEGFDHDPQSEGAFARLLEKTGIAFTGAPSQALMDCIDKGKTKSHLRSLGLPTADWHQYEPGFTFAPPVPRLRLPCIVKPQATDASHGLTERSLVNTLAAMQEQVERIHALYGQAALVEEFLPGREFNVLVMGPPLRIFRVAEINYILSAGKPRLLTYASKWEEDDEYFAATQVQCPALLPHHRAREIEHLAARAFTALVGCGYARVDMRMDREDRIMVLLAILLAVTAGALWFRARANGLRRAVTWDCGYAAPTARMQYTGGSFAALAVGWFAWVLQPECRLRWPRGPFPRQADHVERIPETVLERAMGPVSNVVMAASAWVRQRQQGHLPDYILYLVAGLAAVGVLAVFGSMR